MEVGCEGCALREKGQGFCKPEGDNSYGVLIITDPFDDFELWSGDSSLSGSGRAGQVFNRFLERTKHPISGAPLQREKFLLAGASFCKPPQGTAFSPGALEHCRPNLDKLIQEKKPKAILALGPNALFRLTGLGRERRYGIEYWRGSVLESPYGWVIPTFHPSHVMKGNFHLAQVFINDLQRALRVAQQGVPSRTLEYVQYPDSRTFQGFIQEWRAVGRPPLAFDIETPYSNEDEDALDEEAVIEETSSYHIYRISFAFRENHSITVSWTPPYIAMCQELLGEAPFLTVFNEKFDVPRLVANGVEFTGEIWDAMEMFHRLYPALPKGLQFTMSLLWGDDFKSWKHLSNAEPEWYSCHDSATLLKCFNYCKAKLIEQGSLENFKRHFVQIGRILRKMSKRGVGANVSRRASARERFKAEMLVLLEQLQPLIPLELKPKKIYKISKEQLERKFGPLGEKEWTTVEETLTEKELMKLEEKQRKQEEKERVRLAKSAKPKKPRKRSSSGTQISTEDPIQPAQDAF